MLRSGRDDKREGIAFHLHRVDRMDRAEPSIPVASFTPTNQPSPLSSRPERSVVEGSAVRLSDFPNSHADTLARATAKSLRVPVSSSIMKNQINREGKLALLPPLVV